MDTLNEEGSPDRGIGGFWRRLGAFAIDAILTGLVGMIVGAVLFDALAHMGVYARLIGFAIALAYFGICNSRIGGGQTLGKRWLGVRVVDVHGRLLSLPRSLLRYSVLGIPFFANGLPIDPGLAMSTPLGYGLSIVVFGGMFAIIYLYLFNRRSRQSLHDLAVGSYVVRVDRTQAMPFPIIWNGHIVVVALFALIALGAPLATSRLVNTQAFADILPLYQTLSKQPHVVTAQVMRGWTSMNGGKASHYLQSSLRLDAPLTEDAAMARRIAQLMAKGDPDIAREDAVVVALAYGFDMGIASGWRSHVYSFKPGELQ